MSNENELKVGDVISCLHLGDWYSAKVVGVYGDGSFSTRHGNRFLGNEGVDWQRSIHPSLIPKGFELIKSSEIERLNQDKVEQLEAAKAEIERLRQVVFGCAAYHQGYADKLKESDPARSERQQYRANLLTDFVSPKPD